MSKDLRGPSPVSSSSTGVDEDNEKNIVLEIIEEIVPNYSASYGHTPLVKEEAVI